MIRIHRTNLNGLQHETKKGKNKEEAKGKGNSINQMEKMDIHKNSTNSHTAAAMRIAKASKSTSIKRRCMVF